MRLGFILGFLVGGGAASLIARSAEEAASLAGEASDAAAEKGNPVVGHLKHQVNEARDAAREAQLEKEAEMQLMYEEMVHRKDTPTA